MNPLLSLTIQIGLIVAPVTALAVIKSRTTNVKPRLIAAAVLAVACGAVAYYAADHYGWRPPSRSSTPSRVSPGLIAAMTSVGLLIALAVQAVAKPQKKNEGKA